MVFDDPGTGKPCTSSEHVRAVVSAGAGVVMAGVSTSRQLRTNVPDVAIAGPSSSIPTPVARALRVAQVRSHVAHYVEWSICQLSNHSPDRSQIALQ